MTIFRAPRPESAYLTVLNAVVRDERLSYRARGLLCAVLSRPDNWRTTAAQLAMEGREGREAVRTALGELEAAGYLERVRTQDQRGRWSTVTKVYDAPRIVAGQSPAERIVAGGTEDGLSDAGLPGAGLLGAIRTTEKNNREEPSGGRTAPRAASDDSTSKLIAEWIDGCRRRPPGTVIAQVGKHLKAMLAEGWEVDDLRRGLAAWAGKSLHPSALPSVVNEIVNRPTSRPGRPTALDAYGRPEHDPWAVNQ